MVQKKKVSKRKTGSVKKTKSSKPTKTRKIGVKTKEEPPVSRKSALQDAKFFYFFGGGKAEGAGDMKDTLGGKGAGLAEMTNVGIPVPPGFTISTDACKLYYESGLSLPKSFDKEMMKQIHRLEKMAGAEFGNPSDPLLISVRSGAKFSMPGMMNREIRAITVYPNEAPNPTIRV